MSCVGFLEIIYYSAIMLPRIKPHVDLFDGGEAYSICGNEILGVGLTEWGLTRGFTVAAVFRSSTHMCDHQRTPYTTISSLVNG